MAMQILTPDVMEDLLNFQNKYKTKFEIFVQNDELYIRYFCGPMFEAPSLNKGAYNEEILRKYYNIFDLTYTLSNEIVSAIEDIC